jgi:cell wall-associated NlpC family hydrolase
VPSAILVALAALGVLGTGCAQQTTGPQQTGQLTGATSAATSTAAVPKAHPQAIEPVAGAVPQVGAGQQAGAVSRAPARPSSDPAVVSVGPVSSTLPQPTTEAQVRRELAASGMTASASQATLTPAGLVIAPIDAPAAVQEVIAAGNQIARLPYRWGGGHLTYEDTAYDCSGSISYVFAAAHLLDHTLVSGQLQNWGDPGPGRWITVFANAGHTFMYVAGLRFDTVALAQTGSRWSDRPANEPGLSAFAVRHPPGL